MKSLVLMMALFPLCALAQEAKVSPPSIRIELIEGAKTVKVLKGLKSREAAAGDAVMSGERVKTGKQATVTLLYVDGSTVVIKPESEFQVEGMVKATQWNRLRLGQVRGVVTKVPDGEEAPPRPRFLIRSKTAVMGVRGTDFVMAFSKGIASVHTLEGAVEVAQTETALLGGQGTPVGAGQMVEGTFSGISSPKAFNTEEFIQAFENPSGAASSKGAGVATSAAAMGSPPAPAPAEAPNIPLPQMAPPPQLQPEQQRQVDAAEAKKAEEEKRKIRLAAFRASAIYLRPPGSGPLRLVGVSWIPSFPIPYLPLEIRAQAGGGFFQNGSLNSKFVLHEYHLFAALTIAKTLLVEGGFGWQLWRNDNDAGRAVTMNLGYILNPNGFLNHVYVGQTLLYPFRREQITIHETRVGVGLVAF